MSSQPTQRTYVLPNTTTENTRLDTQHVLLTKIFNNNLHLAPLNPSTLHRALEIGAGTGTWAREFAKKYPQTQILAFDIEDKISSSSPDSSTPAPPKNIQFQLADLADEKFWAQAGKFDYIHARLITPSVRDWPTLLQRCHDHLNPNGYLELQDLHFPFRAESAEETSQSKLVAWTRDMISACLAVNLDVSIAGTFPQKFQELGFEDVKMETFKEPTGPWDKSSKEAEEVGRLGQENISSVLPVFSKKPMMRFKGWSEEEHDRNMQEVLDEIKEGKLRTWLPMTVCYGKKAA